MCPVSAEQRLAVRRSTSSSLLNKSGSPQLPFKKAVWRTEVHFYLFIIIIFYFGLECAGHSFAYVAHFMIFEGCLDSKFKKVVKNRIEGVRIWTPITLTFS
jgi:hypothetical protein